MIEAKGLKLAERRELADTIRARIDSGDDIVHVLLEPGDSTHYELILTRLGTRPFIGATYDRDGRYGPIVSTMGVPAVKLLAGHYWMLSWENFPSMLVDLSPGNYTDPSYVAEKMNLGGGSATIIAELVSMVAGADETILDAMRSIGRVFDRVDDVPVSTGEPVARATSVGDGELSELRVLADKSRRGDVETFHTLARRLRAILSSYGYSTDGTWGVDYETGAIITRRGA